MEIQYQDANPDSGGQSIVLYFDDGMGMTQCVLVDSGPGVNVDELLDDDEYLAGILLTHAHTDHIRSLSANIQPGIPVFATPETASLLTELFAPSNEPASQQYTDKPGPYGWDHDRLTETITPVSEWNQLIPHVDFRPLPVGHAPGAAGFEIRINDGNSKQTMLITGDLSTESVAGNPGFCPTRIDADSVITNLPQSAYTQESEYAESIEWIVEQISAGQSCLIGAGSLPAVHYASTLATLSHQNGLGLEIGLVGHAATAYESLGFDWTDTESITVRQFSAADALKSALDTIDIVLCGPPELDAGSGKSIFQAVRADSSVSIAQIRLGEFRSTLDEDTIAGPLSQWQYYTHATADEIAEILQDICPKQLLLKHGGGSDFIDKCDYSYVWATDEREKFTLYTTQTGWRAPPWMTSDGRELIERKRTEMPATPTIADDEYPYSVKDITLSGPSPLDLAAEGIDSESLAPHFSPIREQNNQSDTVSPDEFSSSAATGSRYSVTTSDGVASEEQSVESTQSTSEAESITEATVIDGGDGITLLRIDGHTPLTHGETISVSLDTTRTS